MFPRFFRPLLASLTLVLGLSLAAPPAQAVDFLKGENEQARVSKPQKERRLFLSWLTKWFGKSGGGMDPNGIGPQD